MKDQLKIGVIGGSQGLGGWMVSFFKEAGYAVRFSSADAQSQFPDNPSLVAYADIVVLAVPISNMKAVLTECFPYLQGKVLIEICSVKCFIIEHFEALKNQNPEINLRFHSLHPMFSEKQAVLQGQVVIENHSTAPDCVHLLRIRQHFEEQGAAWFRLDYQEHDRMMGVVQGLNHFNVFASARTLQRAGLPLEEVKSFASPTYRIFIVIFTRYVLQNPRLYAEIQLFNTYVLDTLRVFREEVNELYRLISEQDEAGFIEYVKTTQGFFADNQGDKTTSDHLIEQLGISLSEQNER